MKKLIYLLIIILFSNDVFSQKSTANLPFIKSNVARISYRENGEFFKDAWRISPQLNPDVHVTGVKGPSTLVSFITDVDSIGFLVKPGDVYQFIVLYGKDSALTEIRGEKFIPPAVFTEEYKRTNEGKTITEIPEVYELANIVFALTPANQNNKWADEKSSDYYKEVISYFGKYSNDTLIKLMDPLMQRGLYSNLKMDAYAFEFDNKGKIIQSPVYDRVAWGKNNTLRPYIPLLQAFADKTKFRQFYKNNLPVYEAQIRGYRDSINTKKMVNWLNEQFPDFRYNALKIIWSPLVGGNQSANKFESNGFKEMHAHVNFPYSYFYISGSKEAIDLKRGNIVFTEINHSFINPEADKYSASIGKAITNLETWGEKDGAAKWYSNPYSMFTEYMNWGLVSLYYLDHAPKSELDTLIAQNERYMLRRGFKKFPEFNQFLVNLFRTRLPNETLAELYPRLVAWFKENE